jgi:hypothetical protein
LLCDVAEDIAKVIDVRLLDVMLLALIDEPVPVNERIVSSSWCWILN